MYGGATAPEMYRSECVSQFLSVHVAFTLFWKVNMIDVSQGLNFQLKVGF